MMEDVLMTVNLTSTLFAVLFVYILSVIMYMIHTYRTLSIIRFNSSSFGKDTAVLWNN